MNDKDLLVKVHGLCERLRDLMQHNFDCHIQTRGEIPEADFVCDQYGSRRVMEELGEFYSDICDEVHRLLSENSRDKYPDVFGVKC